MTPSISILGFLSVVGSATHVFRGTIPNAFKVLYSIRNPASFLRSRSSNIRSAEPDVCIHDNEVQMFNLTFPSVFNSKSFTRRDYGQRVSNK
jgi:hypothetical protein